MGVGKTVEISEDRKKDKGKERCAHCPAYIKEVERKTTWSIPCSRSKISDSWTLSVTVTGKDPG